MNKLIIFLLNLIFWSMLLGKSYALPVDGGKLKVGVALPLSGPVQFLGDNTLKGIKLFLDSQPEFKSKTELIVEDVTSNTGQGVSAVRKLLSVNEIDVLIIEMSPVTNAVAPLIEDKGIPTIAIVGDDCAVNKRYMVKLWMPAINEAREVAKHLDEVGVKKIAIVTTEQDSMLKRSSALKELINSRNIVFDKTVTGLEDLSIISYQINKELPEVLVMNLMPGQFGFLARRMRELGFKGLFVGNAAMDEKNEYKLSQGALDGALFPYSVIATNFQELFKSTYGVLPGLGAANGYDAMRLINDGYYMDSPLSMREKMNQAIRAKNITGALGTYSFISGNQNSFDIPAVMEVVKKSRYDITG